MDLLLLAILFTLIFIIYLKVSNPKKSGKHPPGPSPLPLLGNALSFGKKPHLTYNKWSEEFGKIYTVYLGSDRQIVLSDVELIKKAFQHPSLQGRPRMEVAEYDGPAHGIIFTSGQEWQEKRRFTLRHLRDFGFGKNYMETLILEEIDEIVDWLKSHEAKPVSVNRKFTLAVLNSLWRIITGKRFKHDDTKLAAIFEQMFIATRDVNPMFLFMLPSLAKLFPNLSGWAKFRDFLVKNHELVMDPVVEHRAEFTKELQENPRDFIDAYLKEIRSTEDPTSSFYGALGEKSLAAVANDLFQAGSVTTSTTLTWAVLYLVLHPDVQIKLQKEIDDVVGPSRNPSLRDRPIMTYTEAVIHEVMRKSSLAPFGVFHTATENTSFVGYDIPKGTTIVPNLFYVHHDPETWGDPENFRPERFISPEGKIQKKEYVIPFSVGKRACIGETLARDEIFLFMTRLFQRFEIRADPNRPIPSMGPVPVFQMLEAEEFFIIVNDRMN